MEHSHTMPPREGQPSAAVVQITCDSVLPAGEQAEFDGWDVRTSGGTTVLTARGVDQAALHGMLEMIRALGLDLLEARQIEASPPGDDPGATDHGQHGVVRPDGGRRPR